MNKSFIIITLTAIMMAVITPGIVNAQYNNSGTNNQTDAEYWFKMGKFSSKIEDAQSIVDSMLAKLQQNP